MCPVTIGVGLGATAGAGAATLGMAAIGLAATSALQIYGANQQAGIAQANLRAQAQQAQVQADQTRAQMLMNQDQEYQRLVLSQRQNAEAYNLQIEQANNQLLNQYEQQRAQAIAERASIMRKNEIDRQSYQDRLQQAKTQIGFNNEAANKVYQAEQQKIVEAKKQAAFEHQSLLAKSIGSKGSILATGRTGQSVGLLLKDVERQKGFAMAQADAMSKSKRASAIIAMEGGWLKAQSANQQAISDIGFNPTDPYIPKLPGSPQFINPIGLAIDYQPNT
tara:strand:- start:2727 stop:3560 length:834 start_codon:yes stop_codon:yes gene_type:complete